MATASFRIEGEAEHAYRFPAQCARAFAFHRDFARLIRLLPHIRLTGELGPRRYRLAYGAKDAGLYDVQILCDVVVQADDEQRMLTIRPLDTGAVPVTGASMYGMSGSGSYTSTIAFVPDGDATRVECRLSLQATLPVAHSLRLVPRALVARAAEEILQRRVREILDGFAQRSIDAFRKGQCAADERAAGP